MNPFDFRDSPFPNAHRAGILDRVANSHPDSRHQRVGRKASSCIRPVVLVAAEFGRPTVTGWRSLPQTSRNECVDQEATADCFSTRERLSSTHPISGGRR